MTGEGSGLVAFGVCLCVVWCECMMRASVNGRMMRTGKQGKAVVWWGVSLRDDVRVLAHEEGIRI